MAIKVISGSDFENFQMKVTDTNGNEIAFQDYDNVYVTLVDEYGGTVSQYDTAGVNNKLTLQDTTGSGDSETLEINIFKEDTADYNATTLVYAQIDVEYSSRPGYSGSPAYKRLFDEKNVITLNSRR